MKVRAFISVILVLAFVSSCATQQANNSSSLLSNLQKGGYVVFFRHAATDSSQRDTDLKDPTNCAAQRQLNDRGREQSRIIGEGFKSQGIPVGKIISSQFCRCTDTANIAFGRTETSIDITSIQGVTLEEKKRRINSIRKLLNTAPEPGTNTVLVAHKWMFKDASGILLQEGEAAIFQPQKNTAVAKVVRQVKPEEWAALD